jgi:hypothetical protein
MSAKTLNRNLDPQSSRSYTSAETTSLSWADWTAGSRFPGDPLGLHSFQLMTILDVACNSSVIIEHYLLLYKDAGR